MNSDSTSLIHPTASIAISPPLGSTAAGRSSHQTAASAQSVAISVHFVPRWPKNPYHTELARLLACCNVSVREESQPKQITAAVRRTGRVPQIIHLHALPPFSVRPTALVRFVLFWWRLKKLRRAGAKLVWTVHNAIDHESKFPRIDLALARWNYRSADAVIVHSAGARDLVESLWRIRRSHNVFIVHHGHFIDCYPAGISRADARTKLGLPASSLVFLFLGTVRPYKGVRQLVAIFKSLDAPDARLIIAGEPLSRYLEAEIVREIDGCESIDFRPQFVADDQLQCYMAAADVVVFPYTKALTSGALILAMSFGRACIAPRIGALADTLDASGGFLYEPSDPDGLQRALAAAVEQRAILPSMGAHNRHRAECWGWDEAARKTAAVYETCLAAPRG